MLKKIRNLFLSATAAAAVICAAPAAEKPADVFLTVTTKGFDASINEIESVATETIKGTPFQMFLMPGALKMMMFQPNNEFGLSADFIEGDKPVTFGVFFDQPKKRPRPFFLLPVGDLKAKLEGLAAVGSKFETDDKGITTIRPARGGSNHLMEIGGGYVILTESKRYIEKAKTIIGDWRPAASTKTLTAMVDTQTIYNNFKPQIDAFPNIAATQIDSPKNKMPDQLKTALRKAIPVYGDMVVDLLRGSAMIEITLDSSIKGLDLEITQMVKAGSNLESFNKVMAANNTKAECLKTMDFLPKKSYSVMVADLSPETCKPLYKFTTDLSNAFGPALNETFGIDIAPIFADSDKFSDLVLSGSSTSAFLDKDLSSSAVTIGNIKKGKEAEVLTITKNIFKALDKALIKIDDLVKVTAGNSIFSTKLTEKKIGNLDVVLYDYNIINPAPANNPMDKMVLELSNKVNQKKFCFGTYKGLMIMTMGDNREQTFSETIKLIDGGKPVFPANMKADYKNSKNDNIAYGAFYLNNFLKQLFASGKDMAATMAPPQILGMIEKGIKTLPASKAPITTTMGATPGKFTMRLSLPVAAIKDVYDQGVATFMQMQMMQKMNGGTPAPQPKDDNPADVM